LSTSDIPSPPETAARRLPLGYIALLIAAALMVLTPGITSLPLTDRDEALYVQATKQMLETGDWIDIRFQEAPRYKKPVGIYWLQGLSAAATGQGADAPLWAYRLPSLLGAIAAMLFAAGIAARFAGPMAGLVAGLLCLSTFTLGFEARLAKTDAVLAATVLAAQYALALLWLDPERKKSCGRNALFWTAIGVGVLIKGPITPLIAGLTLATLMIKERKLTLWRALAPLWGLLWVLTLDLPWLAAIAWISKGAFFAASVGQDMLGKVASGQQGHGAPPGTYIVTAFGIFWPLAALLPAVALTAWQRRRDPRVQFLLAWVVPGWLLFEAVTTKLPNYLLPFMPAFAIMAALTLTEGGLARLPRWARWPLIWLPLAGTAVIIGLNVAFWQFEGRVAVVGLALGVAGAALAWLAWARLSRDDLPLGIAASTAAAGLIFASAYMVIVPAARGLWLSDEIAAAVRAARTCDKPVTSVVDYREPSIIVRLGTFTRVDDALGAAASFQAAACAVAVVGSQSVPAFEAALRQAGTTVTPTSTIKGRNLGNGRERELLVFAK
jgi:4-amino-4-deoxy-L-arabinose transferase-like glycosyltransferase